MVWSHAKLMLIWEPKEDITAYELALAMKVLFATQSQFADVKATYDTLPEAAQRHFRRVAAAA